ncbi:polyketide TA biosynthesis protein TaC [Myxococcus xanthus DK 1622]|uniref:Polyketide TA biosynthesis protein TaC n=2 Tax=Myxococcus xanthus TaxID=34 RepID=Q1D5E5_MYXXD|nr:MULTISPECIES: hydroxymethylglutaryl-CoA synthase [Myxococcus]ABF90176.1 polyketide TA biosynthesis protein TaC [Myxococcus xanthus DK 1622]QPM76571.1 hydroxymethylglutaryl-CoA synthase family protein [Myxococcus xanthus]QZZ51638.1 Polyketide biosynthesis 3-hydroxy-3-methylglutaryl-ACP synthase PksG [Myxococcus xanthus]UEO08235.1 hydroxymethylglutaryl-CoA synthase family protein [Myxococcus xanthus DZ2]UYI11383.1 hydroxymethylglutaryl-CoA synthase family protein [Myxococcus xanthus]
MGPVGIEAMNAYCGIARLDVLQLATHRGLDTSRFANLLMEEKTVPLPYEDPVTYGVNAARPILDQLTAAERDSIELLVACTESSFDFGKAMSTYLHQHLGLSRNCRLIELKSACYSGVAGLQMAVNFILSGVSPGAKALVVASDLSRFSIAEGGDASTEDWSFAEPSSGAGAVAMLVSDTPRVFRVDVGANGYYGYEVMDTCRPVADSEAGDADLSLLSYLDCCENAFREYTRRVPAANYAESFGYLAFHTPFGGMVKGAHRTMMRKFSGKNRGDIEADFQRRVAPGLTYCQRVGNIMGATMALSLLGTIDHGDFATAKRIGCFSYGSGCSSEFFSGVVTEEGQQRQRALGLGEALGRRQQLSMPDYDALLKGNGLVRFGTRNAELDFGVVGSIRPGGWGRPLLFLSAIRDFHRDYQWIS